MRLLTSLAVVNLQQEGIDLAIRMGQGDWEGMESRHLFADEQLVVAAPGYRSGDLPTTPQAIAASDIIFSMESWHAWCSQAGLEKPIVPAGLRLNDSNLVLEAVRLGAGVALERRSLVAGAIARGELVQLTAVTVPYPWHYWLTVSPQAENRPEVARFIAWLGEEIALWRQQISA
ncbi:glycine cleavage system transcriptional activator [Klebsiella pneumoniae]|nr:glycine cleavage system transcriptional activator [Klebsiella pneumoniae]SYR44790.1 glycine cleavage system transcriptional activator [Klebsiella pneumoniae]